MQTLQTLEFEHNKKRQQSGLRPRRIRRQYYDHPMQMKMLLSYPQADIENAMAAVSFVPSSSCRDIEVTLASKGLVIPVSARGPSLPFSILSGERETDFPLVVGGVRFGLKSSAAGLGGGLSKPG
jgi:hypothetical protein